MFDDEKINYSDYLASKPQETDFDKLSAMKSALVEELEMFDVHGRISATYYQDGRIKVDVNGKYYGMFDTNAGKFFSGAVGDYN